MIEWMAWSVVLVPWLIVGGILHAVTRRFK